MGNIVNKVTPKRGCGVSEFLKFCRHVAQATSTQCLGRKRGNSLRIKKMKKTNGVGKGEGQIDPPLDLTPGETRHVIQRGVDELGVEEQDALFGLGLRAIIKDALGRYKNRCQKQKQGKALKQNQPRGGATENCSPRTLNRKSSNR